MESGTRGVSSKKRGITVYGNREWIHGCDVTEYAVMHFTNNNYVYTYLMYWTVVHIQQNHYDR